MGFFHLQYLDNLGRAFRCAGLTLSNRFFEVEQTFELLPPSPAQVGRSDDAHVS